MTVAFDKRVVSSPRVLFKDVAGEAVLLDLDTETYFGLDEVGARCWQLLTVAPSVAAVLDALLEEYDVPADKLRDDLGRLVDDLVEQGLLRVAHD